MDYVSTLKSSLSREEFANAVTHGLGVLLCLAGIPLLLQEAGSTSAWSQQLGLCVFCTSLFMVYFSSTIYHGLSAERQKRLWHRIDHMSIYFLIGGTHTPFLLYYAEAEQARFFLWLIWGLVGLGVLYKLFFFGRYEWLSVLYYVILGWMALFTIPVMISGMSEEILFWIIAGGLSYTFGVIFFLWEKLPYHHAIWHLFVLGGSGAHFAAMYLTLAGA